MSRIARSPFFFDLDSYLFANALASITAGLELRSLVDYMYTYMAEPLFRATRHDTLARSQRP